MSNLVVNRSFIDTYEPYWTYLDDVADSNKESLREGRPAPVPRLGCARRPNPIVAGHAIEAQNEM